MFQRLALGGCLYVATEYLFHLKAFPNAYEVISVDEVELSRSKYERG